jgi:hypothetical protein
VSVRSNLDFYSLEHTRHRSPVNFLVHILACVSAYVVAKNKVKLDNLTSSWLALS